MSNDARLAYKNVMSGEQMNNAAMYIEMFTFNFSEIFLAWQIHFNSIHLQV